MAWFSATAAHVDDGSAAGHGQRGVEVAHQPRRGSAWLARFDASGEAQALELAIGYLEQATKAIPAEHPHRAEYVARLGRALRRKAERPGDAADAVDRATARDAILASRSAAETGTAPVMIRALAAWDWGQVAARTGDAAEAVNGSRPR